MQKVKREDIPLWRRILITPDEMAVLTGLSSETVRNYCRKGKLPCIKSGESVKIPREAAIKAFEEIANKEVAFPERHKAEDLKENSRRRRRA